MRFMRWLVVLSVCFPCLAFAGNPEKMDFPYDGQTRSYYFQQPKTMIKQALPLVILLHGGGRDARQVLLETNFSTISDQGYFILVAPDAIDGNWNDGRTNYYTGKKPTADDEGFLTALIADLQQKYTIDPSQIYIVGASNGGEMAYRMACDRSDIVSGFAAVIATMTKARLASCKPAKPIKAVIIAGTKDPFMPFEGGVVTRDGKESDDFASIADTVSFWAEHNGCSSEPMSKALEDRNPRDGSTLYKSVYQGCDTPTVLVTMRGAGHHWPRREPYRFAQKALLKLLGPANLDIDAADLIWQFLSAPQ